MGECRVRACAPRGRVRRQRDAEVRGLSGAQPNDCRWWATEPMASAGCPAGRCGHRRPGRRHAGSHEEGMELRQSQGAGERTFHLVGLQLLLLAQLEEAPSSAGRRACGPCGPWESQAQGGQGVQGPEPASQTAVERFTPRMPSTISGSTPYRSWARASQRSGSERTGGQLRCDGFPRSGRGRLAILGRAGGAGIISLLPLAAHIAPASAIARPRSGSSPSFLSQVPGQVGDTGSSW